MLKELSASAIKAGGQLEDSTIRVVSCEHEHQWGEVELARFTGNPHRKCQVPGCKELTMDWGDDE